MGHVGGGRSGIARFPKEGVEELATRAKVCLDTDVLIDFKQAVFEGAYASECLDIDGSVGREL